MSIQEQKTRPYEIGHVQEYDPQQSRRGCACLGRVFLGTFLLLTLLPGPSHFHKMLNTNRPSYLNLGQLLLLCIAGIH